MSTNTNTDFHNEATTTTTTTTTISGQRILTKSRIAKGAPQIAPSFGGSGSGPHTVLGPTRVHTLKNDNSVAWILIGRERLRDHLSPAYPDLIFILCHIHCDDFIDDVIITLDMVWHEIRSGWASLTRSRDRSRPIRIHVAELSFLYYSPNGISIRSAVLAQHMVVSNTHTHGQTRRPQNIGNNRPNLCTPCMRCALTTSCCCPDS